MCSVEVVKEMVLCRAVDDSVLPFVVGGTTVLVTSTVVDVLASVVVLTGVVVSPRLLDGVITSVGMLMEVVLALEVDDSELCSVVVGTGMLLTSTVVNVLVSVVVSTGVVVSP
jgi:hypothetical protein